MNSLAIAARSVEHHHYHHQPQPVPTTPMNHFNCFRVTLHTLTWALKLLISLAVLRFRTSLLTRFSQLVNSLLSYVYLLYLAILRSCPRSLACSLTSFPIHSLSNLPSASPGEIGTDFKAGMCWRRNACISQA